MAAQGPRSPGTVSPTNFRGREDVPWSLLDPFFRFFEPPERHQNFMFFCIAPKDQKVDNKWPKVGSRAIFGAIFIDFGCLRQWFRPRASLGWIPCDGVLCFCFSPEGLRRLEVNVVDCWGGGGLKSVLCKIVSVKV